MTSTPHDHHETADTEMNLHENESDTRYETLETLETLETPETPERERVWSRTGAICFDHATRSYAALIPTWTAGPITRGGLRWRTMAHLFEALKFEHDPYLQARIASRHRSTEARRIAMQCRPDRGWNERKIEAMTHAAREWTRGNLPVIGGILMRCATRPLIYVTRNDPEWGVVERKGRRLVGANRLGRIWMRLREEVRQGIITHDDGHRRWMVGDSIEG